MKSKKLLLSVIFATVAITTAMAQLENSSKFYVKVYGGIGILTPGSYRLVSNSNNAADPNNATTALSKNGLGQGIRVGGGLGVIVNDFLNIGADVEYLSGATLKANSIYNASSYTYMSDPQYSYSALSITPHVIFKALSKPDYLIYTKLGILLNLPFDLKYASHDSANSSGNAYSYNTNGVYKIGLTPGLNVALGVQVRLTDNLRAFGEIFGNYMVVSPDSYDWTQVQRINNGAPTSYHYHTTYIKEGAISSTNNGNETISVAQVAYTRFNMNTIGINLGISLRF